MRFAEVLRARGFFFFFFFFFFLRARARSKCARGSFARARAPAAAPTRVTAAVLHDAQDTTPPPPPPPPQTKKSFFFCKGHTLLLLLLLLLLSALYFLPFFAFTRPARRRLCGSATTRRRGGVFFFFFFFFPPKKKKKNGGGGGWGGGGGGGGGSHAAGGRRRHGGSRWPRAVAQRGVKKLKRWRRKPGSPPRSFRRPADPGHRAALARARAAPGAHRHLAPRRRAPRDRRRTGAGGPPLPLARHRLPPRPVSLERPLHGGGHQRRRRLERLREPRGHPLARGPHHRPRGPVPLLARRALGRGLERDLLAEPQGPRGLPGDLRRRAGDLSPPGRRHRHPGGHQRFPPRTTSRSTGSR